MKILVAGGSGFIGSHLIDALMGKNEIICVDNLSSGSCRNVEHLMSRSNFRFIQQDITKPLKIEGKLDRIYHLASMASPVDFSRHPIEILMTNSLGSYNLLSLAKEKKTRLLFASTSEVYGDPKEHPQKESYNGNVNCIGHRSCYDESKRFGEALCIAFYREKKADVRIARIFNTYGPRMKPDDGRVIPNFITQALDNKPITIYGKGSQTRSFCYVSDLVIGLTSLMESGCAAEPFNIGNPHEKSIMEMAETIKKLTGSKSDIVHKPLPEDDPERRNPDITKAEERLGWEPKIGFEEGLRNTIEWFEKQR
jgi:nucleoside-diphosphate-sugar epimerase